MKKPTQIISIVLFLAIIFSVPLVQTVHEYLKNDGHRIQILDLIEDIFITPLKKAEADVLTLDSLRINAASLVQEISRPEDDSGSSPRPEKIAGWCDEAGIRIAGLKQHVVTYNRHLEGDKNKFGATDTGKPYFRALAKTEEDFSRLARLSAEGTFPDSAKTLAGVVAQETGALAACYGKSVGFTRYCELTLTALNRTMVGADYLRPYEKEMEKSSVFANTVRPWLQSVYFAVYGDLESKGLAGKKPWLFYRLDVDYLIRPPVYDKRSRIVDANDAPIRENIVDSIVAFKKQLAAKNIELLFVIMPVKASLYPGILAPGMEPMASDDRCNSLMMMDSLRKSGVAVVDLFSAFAKERANDAAAGDSLYMKTDTHFKTRGVIATARAVADRVRKYPWYAQGPVEYTIDTITVNRTGDIAEMCDLPGMTKRLGRKLFPAESVVCNRVYKVSRDSSNEIVDHTPYKDDYRNATILVLGDSFSRIYETDQPKSAGWIAHLARELGQPVASLVNDGGASTLVRQSLARKPNLLKNKKLVVWEVVERDFRYGEQGWKGVALQ